MFFNGFPAGYSRHLPSCRLAYWCIYRLHHSPASQQLGCVLLLCAVATLYLTDGYYCDSIAAYWSLMDLCIFSLPFCASSPFISLQHREHLRLPYCVGLLAVSQMASHCPLVFTFFLEKSVFALETHMCRDCVTLKDPRPVGHPSWWTVSMISLGLSIYFSLRWSLLNSELPFHGFKCSHTDFVLPRRCSQWFTLL